MATGVVEFNWAVWAIVYRKLASQITEQIALAYFPLAELYCDNTPCSPICDLKEREVLLNMMLAHIIQLNVGVDGQGPSPLVGRISQATQGTVSVSAQNDYPPGTVQWYQSTTYGAQWWVATTKYRQFLYGAPPPYQADPYADLLFPGTLLYGVQ